MAVHDLLLHTVLNGVFLILLTEDGVDVLGVDDVRVVHLLEVALIVEDLTGSESLLEVGVVELVSHVFDDVDFGRNLSFHCATLGQESLDLRTILLDVVVVDVLDSIHVESGRLMQVVVEGHGPPAVFGPKV